jgi:hypothetical protein
VDSTLETNARGASGSELSPAGAQPDMLFLCLARDCASTLPHFFNYLEQLRQTGIRCTAIIGENGSVDATRNLIQSSGPGVALFDTSALNSVTSRAVRIATGRQLLLDEARKREGSEEFVCIADLDQAIAAPPPPQSVLAAIEQLRTDATLFAIGASSLPAYYDLVSLRAEGFEFLNYLYREIEEAKNRPLSYFQFHQKHIYSVQEKVTRALPLKCVSSFNGFCIYKSDDYFQGSYRAPDEDHVCEHVNFNQSLVRATGKRMLVSLSLAIQAPAEHTRVGFFKFWADRLRERITGRR